MSQTELKVLRAHHLRELYFLYLRLAEVPTAIPPDSTPIQYPILVTDSIDDMCRECRNNGICNGKEAKRVQREDKTVAEILQIKVGAEYSAESLANIFKAKAQKQGIIPGKTYNWATSWVTLAGKFYQS
jgi:hypothetical protein